MWGRMKATLFSIALSLAALSLALSACQHTAQTYRVGPGIVAPKVANRVEPQYTEAARQGKVQGTTVLSVVVDPQGRAQEITVERSVDPGLDQKAIEAIRQWTFVPGTRKGKPVRVAANIEVNFRLL